MLLLLTADPADPEPVPPETRALVVHVAPPRLVPESEAEALEEDEEDEANDHDTLVVGGVSAVGGVVGFAGTAGLGFVIGTVTMLTSGGSSAVGIIFLATLAAMPVGAGIGAGVAHSLVHGEGALGAGIAGVLGSLGGAFLGTVIGVSTSLMIGDPGYAGVNTIAAGVLGCGAGALLGAAVGPGVHALVE